MFRALSEDPTAVRTQVSFKISPLDHREGLEGRVRYSGGVKTILELTAIFESVDDGWVQGRIAQLPAVITAGRSIEEARDLLADALREYFLAMSQTAEGRASDVPEGAQEQSFELMLSG